MAEETPLFKQKIIRYLNNIRQKISLFRKKRPKLAWFILISSSIGLLGILSLTILIVLIHFGTFGKLPTYPDLRDIQHNNASEVYADDGVLLGKYYIENRISADFEEISPNIINALVATEDARFFQHSGVDFRAWMRVFFKTILLSNESSGGGSTLSQQLVKNLYPRKDFMFLSTLINKLKETMVARRLEKIYTKEDLLRLYLNTVPFGENIFGIKVAAQRYFNASSSDLKVEEAAVLVGSLKATTYYNPVKHPERAKKRRNTVLQQMEKYGYLTKAICDSLKNLPVTLRYYREGNNNGLATYFREHLRQELETILENYKKPNGVPYNLYTDGLKIYTSINSSMQKYAEEAVGEHMPKLQQSFYKNWKKGLPWKTKKVIEKAKKNSPRYQALKTQGLSDEVIDEIFSTPVKMQIFSWEEGEVEKEMSPIDSIKYYLTILNTGFLAMEPQSGLIRAWVGGINHKYFQYDHIKSKRPVGSTFKPIVYTQALRNGMLPCEYTKNRSVTYVEYNNWQPRNSNGQYGGVYSMEGALSQSVNSVTVELMMQVGVDSVKQLAKRMGISSDIPEVPAISLGAVDASLIDMIRVYGTFANQGLRPDLHYLDRIETSKGEVIVEFNRPDPRNFIQVISNDHAAAMTKMMKSVVDSGTARRLRYEFGLYNHIAGKTGTTQKHSDGWFIGYTPQLVAGVWVGAESPKVHFRTMRAGQGASTALPIWGKFMQKVYKNPEFKKWRSSKFKPPSDTLYALMQCPPYLEEMPIIMDYWDEELEELMRFASDLDGIDREVLQHYLNVKPRRNRESLQNYSERIRKYNDRQIRKAERRQRRKAFWNKLLFGKEE